MSKKYLWSYYQEAEHLEFAESVDEAIAEAEKGNEGYYHFVYVWEAKEAPYWEFDARRHFEDEHLFSPEDQTCPLEDDWLSYWGANKEQVQQLSEYVSATIRGWKEKHFPGSAFYYTDKFVDKFELGVDTEIVCGVSYPLRSENEDSN